jgi:hypothetical protein
MSHRSGAAAWTFGAADCGAFAGIEEDECGTLAGIEEDECGTFAGIMNS